MSARVLVGDSVYELAEIVSSGGMVRIEFQAYDLDDLVFPLAAIEYADLNPAGELRRAITRALALEGSESGRPLISNFQARGLLQDALDKTEAT